MENRKVSVVPDEIMAAIKQAVNEGLAAGRKEAKLERTPYQRTEARLFALPALIRKVELDNEELTRIKDGGRIPEISKDLVRFRRDGCRVSPEEKLEAAIANLEATIAMDEHEIKVVNTALEQVAGDYYYPVICGRYIERVTEKELAEKLFCDERTIRRNRSRLVKELSVFLYGKEAID